MQLVKRMASYIDTSSENSSSSASESETEIGLFDENGKKISVRGKKITKCKLLLRSGFSLIQGLDFFSIKFSNFIKSCLKLTKYRKMQKLKIIIAIT